MNEYNYTWKFNNRYNTKILDKVNIKNNKTIESKKKYGSFTTDISTQSKKPYNYTGATSNFFCIVLSLDSDKWNTNIETFFHIRCQKISTGEIGYIDVMGEFNSYKDYLNVEFDDKYLSTIDESYPIIPYILPVTFCGLIVR